MRYTLAALLLASSACGNGGGNGHEERRQVMEGLTLSQSDKGNPSWTLKSRRAILREDSKIATLAEPVMEFYKNGKAISRVTALVGRGRDRVERYSALSSVSMDSFEDKRT